MIPIVVTARELKLLRPNAEAVLKKVFAAEGVKIDVKIGTMIEVPRAAIRSGHIARYADFFSFGTNDLTQMTFAFSRDDVASFLPSYLEKVVLDVDPFKSIDEEGVGFLLSYATQQGRAVNPGLQVGICGEHGGDPLTIDFCYRAGLTYVSCSPFRVPVARLAAAQAVLNNPPEKEKAAASGSADKKPAAKKAVVKKAADKKATVKKAQTSGLTAKKPAAKKTPAKKAAASGLSARKQAAKKADVKKARTSGSVAKKSVAKRTPVKKVADKKPAAKKSVVKKTRTSGSAVKKAVKNPAAKNPVTRTMPTKKPQASGLAAKKQAAKKSAAKKAK
jgi:pyruvate,orthophosphate dikinase